MCVYLHYVYTVYALRSRVCVVQTVHAERCSENDRKSWITNFGLVPTLLSIFQILRKGSLLVHVPCDTTHVSEHKHKI